MHDFMECNWDFHDFTIERMTYYPTRRIAELFLKYDQLAGSVVLRFIDIKGYHYPIREDCWEIMDAKLYLLPYNRFLWICDEAYDDIERNKAVCDWFESDRILWAVTNKLGEPDEMPPEKIDQTWNIWGRIEEKHFVLKEYRGAPELTK